MVSGLGTFETREEEEEEEEGMLSIYFRGIGRGIGGIYWLNTNARCWGNMSQGKQEWWY